MVEVQQDNLELVVVPEVQVVVEQAQIILLILQMVQMEQIIPAAVVAVVDHLLHQVLVEMVVQVL